jgi:hypothetical protein
MEISLTSEDISVFRRIYSEKPDAVNWMANFGNPLERMIGGVIKQANKGKT